MPNLLSGFAQGLSQGMSGGGSNAGMNQYQANTLAQRQPLVEAQTQAAQSTTDYNQSKQEGQELKNQKESEDQAFEQQAIVAASKGGFQAAIDFAQKTGHFEWANKRLKEQQELNNSVASGMKLTADADDSQIKAYNDRLKAVGGLGAVFLKETQTGRDPKQVYQEFLPTLKQVWPDAPKEYDDKVGNYFKIAVGQQMVENANYSRSSTVGKKIQELNAARKAGDTEAVKYLTASLQKDMMFVNSQTGDVINLLGQSTPDEHQGSVDSKMAAVGLAANSQIPPVPGAVVQGQPLNNMMDSQYKEYDKNNKIAPEQRTIKNMKSTQGYDTIIRSDGTHEQVAIIGGSADKPRESASESIRVGAIQAGQKSFNDYADMIIDPNTKALKPNVTNILTGQLAQASYIGQGGGNLSNQIINQFVSPEARQIKTAQDNIIEGILRGQSGATINATERPRFEQELLPQPGDDEKTIKIKLTMTHEILTGALKIMKIGSDGKPLTDKNGYAIVDFNTIQKAREYSQNGGDVLDYTRGNGPDPEKARQNQQKELSYDPKQLQFFMSGKNNGQGRDLTEAEAKQFIDGARAAGVKLPGGQ